MGADSRPGGTDMLKRSVIAMALLTLLAPATARADLLLTPNIGVTFGGAAESEHLTYGVSAAWMGGGIFGFEADFHYTPEFFEPNDDDIDFIDDSNVLSLMGNVILGIPIGGQHGGGFRPYGVAGLGLLKSSVTSTDQLTDVNANDFGFNLGVGAMGFFSNHIGIRGEVRYFRSFQDLEAAVENAVKGQFEEISDTEPGSFDFWRANVGVTFRW